MFLNLTRGNQRNIIPLPPVGEQVTPEDADPVKLVGQSTGICISAKYKNPFKGWN